MDFANLFIHSRNSLFSDSFCQTVPIHSNAGRNSGFHLLSQTFCPTIESEMPIPGQEPLSQWVLGFLVAPFEFRAMRALHISKLVQLPAHTPSHFYSPPHLKSYVIPPGRNVIAILSSFNCYRSPRGALGLDVFNLPVGSWPNLLLSFLRFPNLSVDQGRYASILMTAYLERLRRTARFRSEL
jgi:hypothetical protein